MFSKLRDNFGWVKDVAIVFGMVGILYLNGHYVTTERFEAYQKGNDLAHQSIQTTLISVDKTLALMQRNNEQLIENEKSIQLHNSRIAELDARIKAIESSDIDTFMKQSAIHRAQLEVRLSAVETAQRLLEKSK